MLGPLTDTQQLGSSLIAPYPTLSGTTAGLGTSQISRPVNGLTSTGAVSITNGPGDEPQPGALRSSPWSESHANLAGETPSPQGMCHPGCDRASAVPAHLQAYMLCPGLPSSWTLCSRKTVTCSCCG